MKEILPEIDRWKEDGEKVVVATVVVVAVVVVVGTVRAVSPPSVSMRIMSTTPSATGNSGAFMPSSSCARASAACSPWRTR